MFSSSLKNIQHGNTRQTIQDHQNEMRSYNTNVSEYYQNSELG